MKQLWTRYGSAALCLLSLVAVFTLLNLFGIGCPVKYLMGISCPGCGMTRALWNLMTLNLSAALSYHPLCVAMPPVAALLVWFSVKKRTKARSILLWVTAVALVAVWVWRLCTNGGDVVVISPKNGLIGRVFAYLINCF